MTNIFENAKFGDKFVTKDGQVAIYHGYFHGFHCLNIEGVAKHIKCFENGKSCLTEGMPGTNWSDIVSRYNRHIVEEKTDKFIKEAYIELYNVLYNNTKVVKVVKF